ncbi:cysteine desulfurase family protein [Ekhidna sp.]
MSEQPIYLDYNATTPVDDQVLQAMLPYFKESFGNASSVQHAYGWDAEEAVNMARDQVGILIGVKPQNLIFTSGATEAINLGIRGAVASNESKNHIITCCSEHKAVLDTCDYLKSIGVEITILDINADGLIDLAELQAAIQENTLMVCVMSANNETGVLQEMDLISQICEENEILLFSDITQAVGKIPQNLQESNIDIAAFSSHKLYGPKGVGALYVNDLSTIAPMVYGGGHEKGLRSGTLNVPGIVGFGKACEVAGHLLNSEMDRLKKLRDFLESELLQLGGIQINGQKTNRLSHVSNVSFQDIDGSRLIRSLKGIAVSQGSACNSSVIEPSHVLKGMGISDQLAFSSLRISLGRFTSEEEVRKAIQIIRSVIEQQRMQLL